jgi:superfamily II DNA/RNA helicase
VADGRSAAPQVQKAVVDAYFGAKPGPLKCFVTAEAGGGKTLAALLAVFDRLLHDTLPLRVRRPGQTSAVVVVNTLEVAGQWIRKIEEMSNGLITVEKLIQGEGDTSSRKHVIIATPGKFKSYVDRLAAGPVPWDFFVLDEADRVLQVCTSGVGDTSAALPHRARAGPVAARRSTSRLLTAVGGRLVGRRTVFFSRRCAD